MLKPIDFVATLLEGEVKYQKHCLKVENGNGEEVSLDDYYKISFHVSENKEHEKTDAIREAFGELDNDMKEIREAGERLLRIMFGGSRIWNGKNQLD